MSLTKSEKKTLQPWYDALVQLDLGVLDRIVKATVRHFGVDKNDPDEQEMLAEALDGDARAKGKYLMGFYPVFTDDGLVAFFIANARRWKLQVPGDAPSARTPRAARAEKPSAARTGGGKKEPVLELVVPGDHARVAAALGFRRVPDAKYSTVLKQTAKFVVSAEPGRGVVGTFDLGNTSAALRFARRRLAEEPQLQRRAVIAQKNGTVPDLPERVVERGMLRRTAKGYKLLDAAA